MRKTKKWKVKAFINDKGNKVNFKLKNTNEKWEIGYVQSAEKFTAMNLANQKLLIPAQP